MPSNSPGIPLRSKKKKKKKVLRKKASAKYQQEDLPPVVYDDPYVDDIEDGSDRPQIPILLNMPNRPDSNPYADDSFADNVNS